MGKFLKEVHLFLIPFYLFAMWCLVPIVMLSTYSEMYFNKSRILEPTQKSIVGFGFKQDNLAKYKWAYMQQNVFADVWAIGSSRALPFRQEMFSSSFYNAGYTIRQIGDFESYLKTFDSEKYPKLVVVVLDQWLFTNADFRPVEGRTSDEWSEWDVWGFDIELYKQVWGRLLDGEFVQKYIPKDDINYYGLNAGLNGRGFRSDGSVDLGVDLEPFLEQNPETIQNMKDDMRSRIDSKVSRFESESEINVNAIKVLSSFLDFCVENNIKVISILPPYADFTIQMMEEDGGYSYMDLIYSELYPSHTTRGFEIYDFTKLEYVGSNDKEITDGFHAAEIVYHRMLMKIVETNPNSVLLQFVDEESLRDDFNHRTNNLEVYDY